QAPLQFRLSKTKYIVELLQAFVVAKDARAFHVRGLDEQRGVLRALAEALHRGGDPQRAAACYNRAISLENQMQHQISHKQMLADALYLAGRAHESCRTIAGALGLATGPDKWPWEEAVALTTAGRI